MAWAAISGPFCLTNGKILLRLLFFVILLTIPVFDGLTVFYRRTTLMNSLENENFIHCCCCYCVYISTTSFLLWVHVQLAFLLDGDYVLYDIIRKILVCIWSLFHARIYYCPCPMHFFALLLRGLLQMLCKTKNETSTHQPNSFTILYQFFPLWWKASSCFLKMSTTVAAMIMMMGQLLLFLGGLVSLLKSLQYIVYVMSFLY